MARSNRKKFKKQSDNISIFHVVSALGALAVIIGGFGWFYIQATENNIPLGNDLCPKAGTVAHTLVLFDTTDPMSRLTQNEVTNKLTDLVAATKKGALFELRVLEVGEARTNTLFSVCNPGDGSDLDHLTGNPAQARRRWEEGFSAPLNLAMQRSIASAEAENSPIMAAIQQIAVDHLSSADGRATPTHIVVVSDMLENTEYFSHYRSGADYSAYLQSSAAQRYATDLGGAKFTIWMIRRGDGTRQSRDLISFWATWIGDNGGAFDRATALQGIE